MLRKFAAVGMLALCSLTTGCWFNSPCCSPYDKAGPTFGDDPSIPNDFNYRKGSILGSDYSVGGEYVDDGVEYLPTGKANAPDTTYYAPDNTEYVPNNTDYAPDDADYAPDGGMVVNYEEEQPQPFVEEQPDPVAQYIPPEEPAQYMPQPQPVTRSMPQPRRMPGLFRIPFLMNRGATYQGMRDHDRDYQNATYQGAGNPRPGYQGASSYRTGTNPRYRSQRSYDDFDQDETEE